MSNENEQPLLRDLEFEIRRIQKRIIESHKCFGEIPALIARIEFLNTKIEELKHDKRK